MLARVRRSDQLKEAATQEYSHALGLLTRAVSNKKESRANATLPAVLLLVLFEMGSQNPVHSVPACQI